MAAIFGLGKGLGTKYNPRILPTLALQLGLCTFIYYVGKNVGYGLIEGRVVMNSQLIEKFSKKYDFTIFDFAQAKKESHLKELRNELTSESSNLLYS